MRRAYSRFHEKSLFPMSLFWTVFGMLLLVSGIQIGLIVLSGIFELPAAVTIHVMLLYWVCVSVLVVLYIRRKIYRVYDVPLQNISEVMARVAGGDFSVRVPSLGNSDGQTYMDCMIYDLNKMIEELGGMETLRTDFIASVSHELKTPLASMQNYATMLQTPGLDEKRRLEYARELSTGCRRLGSLVTNILRLNRLENQQIYPTVAPYDLGEQLRECILAFEDSWNAKGIELEADIEDGIMLTTDGELLSLVWNNFLSNAIKFTPEGGRICVRLESLLECSFKVSIKDNGCGMDERTMKHAFEKFFQGDSSHASQGNGLGLALAARVASICGGKISVESKPGMGSTFSYCM